MIKNTVILIVLCLLTHSCIDSERVKRLVGKNDSTTGIPEYVEGKHAMLDEIKSTLKHDKVITGFQSGTRNGASFNGLMIIIKDAPVSYDNEDDALKLADQIDPIIKKHIKNLTDFDLYKVEFTTSTENENVEKVTSIKITQEQLTPIL